MSLSWSCVANGYLSKPKYCMFSTNVMLPQQSTAMIRPVSLRRRGKRAEQIGFQNPIPLIDMSSTNSGHQKHAVLYRLAGKTAIAHQIRYLSRYCIM